MNFNFIEKAPSAFELRGLVTTSLPRTEHYSWGTLAMILFEEEAGIQIQLKSRKEMYSPAMIEGLLRDFRVILERSLSAQSGVCRPFRPVPKRR